MCPYRAGRVVQAAFGVPHDSADALDLAASKSF